MGPQAEAWDPGIAASQMRQLFLGQTSLTLRVGILRCSLAYASGYYEFAAGISQGHNQGRRAAHSL